MYKEILRRHLTAHRAITPLMFLMFPISALITEQQSRLGLQLTISTIISLWMNH